jgi:hypothetical protein
MTQRESQNKRLLKWLISGRSISFRRADYVLNIPRLAARIRDLKDIGIIIEDKMEYVGKDFKFKRYWIDKKICERYRKLKAA